MKEDEMLSFVSDYKDFFNLEDRFDHFFSSIDTKIRFVSKEGRWVEILVLISTVNAYMLFCEMKTRELYPGINGRRVYKAEVAKDLHRNITHRYPIKEFFLEVCDSLASLPL